MRTFTALLIVGLCVFCGFRGWSIIEFTGGRALVGEPSDHTSRAWLGVPAISMAALDDTLTDLAGTAGVDGARKRADLLTQVLSVRPLSSVSWLDLSGMWLVMGEPYARVLGALKMSAITGPNEESVMWQRATFGLLQWEALPADARERTISDLSGVMLDDEPQGSEASEAKRVLAAKADKFRSQIASMLTDVGVSSAGLARLGLQAPSRP